MRTAEPRVSPTRSVFLHEIDNWHIETDVAVVGLGGAGACAAIESHDSGAEVAVFELASAGGGSTAMSEGEVYLLSRR